MYDMEYEFDPNFIVKNNECIEILQEKILTFRKENSDYMYNHIERINKYSKQLRYDKRKMGYAKDEMEEEKERIKIEYNKIANRYNELRKIVTECPTCEDKRRSSIKA